MKTLITIAILLFTTCPLFAQWVRTAGTPEGAGITDMVVTPNGTVVVTCASFNFPTGMGGIRHSTNQGTIWISDFRHYTARTLALGQDGWVWASSWDYPTTTEGLYVSTNQGTNWGSYRYLIGANNNIFSILVRDNNQTVYIGTRSGIMKSTNAGFNFTAANNGIPANSWVRDLESSSSGIIFAATTNGLFRSTNGGSNWLMITGIAAGDTVVSLAMINTPNDFGNSEDLVAGTDNSKVYKSRGDLLYLTATVATLFDAEVEVRLIGSGSLIPGTEMLQLMAGKFPRSASAEGGVATSTNGGANWTTINEGLPNPAPVSGVTIDKGSGKGSDTLGIGYIGLFMNMDGGARVYKRVIPAVGIQQISTEVPEGFSLSQNYPNPFNPATKIKFAMPKSSFVKLTVYDGIGREVATLVNKQLTAGTYEADWKADKFSTGVYFYKLETADFTETKKMLMIK